MRDFVITLLVFGSLPYIFKRPSLGMVMWIWISVMNPHTQGWGFAREFPFAAIIAVTTVAAMATNAHRKYRYPLTPVTVTFLLFIAYMCLTAAFAIHPDQIMPQLIKVLKIMGMTIVVMMLLRKRKHVEWLIWTVVISIGFYGVKGGIFTLRSGGQYRVWGPIGTFIDGNNEIALALVMTIPLMLYLYTLVTHKWAKRAMIASMLLCALASIASYSRGAAIAMVAMLAFLWLKSRNKAMLGTLMVLCVPVAMVFMPEQWHERIDTIDEYEQDMSAMGRINAWWMAFHLANDRPLGGGFEIYDSYVFQLYAPIPEDVHAAHSIYFQVLGEHGWGGLAIYLTLGILTWLTGSRIISRSAPFAELAWAGNLARMVQVSLLGFAVGGAFLSLAYFDVPYYLMAAMAATRLIVERERNVLVPKPLVNPLAPEPDPPDETAPEEELRHETA
ncbi:putative O-glycosylation ligase, exosortase A system-associated [Pseudoduganella umbonata]|uniref:O-glycosylation ligase, exosortase A system-associated n=1 Tax=Pseudoduganella umbonata TaxID=864828 RepID=A0A4P8HSE5_9BURK|nr:putative O-glycosylation ligase, exosortase A system-associated [Pseudoduganella umbonata]MBB3223802.1 putative O-glycosylation ligase (exosortase A-associated) [Pseudoduganella umbonata]QCP12777.1 putative O-glycosylation ligase, exosortase A system-associated [Pseudoduganella umbonata]